MVFHEGFARFAGWKSLPGKQEMSLKLELVWPRVTI
jgi:hypothetical protein